MEARSSLPLLCTAVLLAAPHAEAVLVADNGFGTANMPLAADYIAETPMQIVDGLPVGSPINIAAVFKAPTFSAEVSPVSGSMGGTTSGGQTVFEWNMTGTGSLSGYNRSLNIPLNSGVGSHPGLGTVGFEVHTAPRTPFSSIQYFDTQMFRLFGQITGDPDFDLLRLVAGNDFGMPSPGETSLSQSGGSWEAGSFFDLTYRIDFIGRAGGPLSGMSGSTTQVVRISVGTVVPEPSGMMLTLTVAGVALIRRRRQS